MKQILIVFCTAALFLTACNNEDYLIDGGKASPYVNMSTYDFLSSKSLFDTLVIAIDRAGLKEIVNGDVTFFAPTNFSFTNYVNEMTILGRAKYNDPNYQYHFDSIPAQLLQDSLRMYVFPGKIQRENLRKEGNLFTNLAGTELKVSLEPDKEEYKDELNDPPEYIYLTHKRGRYWDDYGTEVAANEKDTKERIQTSGLLSTNGVIHVIANSHVLFFYKRQ